MKLNRRLRFALLSAFSLLTLGAWLTASVYSQPPGGGPNAPDVLLVTKFDGNNDGYLDAKERKAAREELKSNNFRRRRRGPRGGGSRVAGKPGPKVAVGDAKVFANDDFYDPKVVRTLFLEFESDEWESELNDFKPTDVEIPAKLTADGITIPNVGVSFRGASSFFMIPQGSKRSFNISIDFLDEDQRLHGYKSLNLLNCNGDASMMSSMLYSHLSRERIAAPKVNYVKVVVNGESWGLYVSSQQFNKIFLKENFETKKGARWKVSGSPNGDGGLRYLGEEIEPYKERFEIKSKDKESSWKKLIELCRILNETPQEELEAKLEPILDIDGALWFLAVDVASVNSDGYWTRASDYSLYMHPDGKFHVLPHDMNEAFQMGGHGGPGGGFGPPPGGGGFGPPGDGFGPPRDRRGPPGGGFLESLFGGGGPPSRGRRGGRGGRRGPGGPGHGGVDLDPLTGLDAEHLPLRSVLLNHPEWQRQYLENIRTLAEMMKWENIGPLVEQSRELIRDEVAIDTRKLFTTEQFLAKTSSDVPGEDSTSLRAFFKKRSEFLLNHPKIKELGSSK